MKEFIIATTKPKELILFLAGFLTFLFGLYSMRYSWTLVSISILGAVMMGLTGENLREINLQEKEGV
jgi:uncharacterized membrane protein YesL